MKSTILKSIAAITIFVTLAIPIRLAAQVVPEVSTRANGGTARALHIGRRAQRYIPLDRHSASGQEAIGRPRLIYE
jgi:hypothetical protein